MRAYNERNEEMIRRDGRNARIAPYDGGGIPVRVMVAYGAFGVLLVASILGALGGVPDLFGDL